MDKRKCCASGELFVLVLLVSAVTQSAPIDQDAPTSQFTTVTNPQCDNEEASSQDVPRSRRALLDDQSQETLLEETHLEPNPDSDQINALDRGVKLISILPATRTDVTNFLGVNPHTGEKELDKNNTYAFEYTKGYRIPGDEVLVSDSRYFQFPIQDISLTIFYPKGNTMVKQYVITAFRLRVSQDSPEGEGYLTAGGISLEQLGLRMVAAGATVFSFELVIFGILQDLLSPDYIPEGIRPRDAGISLNNTRH